MIAGHRIMLRISAFAKQDTRSVRIYFFSPDPKENRTKGVKYCFGEHTTPWDAYI